VSVLLSNEITNEKEDSKKATTQIQDEGFCVKKINGTKTARLPALVIFKIKNKTKQ